MASEQDFIKLGFDASEAVNAFQALTNAMFLYNATVDKITAAHKHFNEKGAMANVTIKALDAAGRDLHLTMNTLKKDWTEASVAVGGTAKTMDALVEKQRKLAEEAKRLADASRGKAEGRFFVAGIRQTLPKTLSFDEAGKFRSLFGQIVNLNEKMQMSKRQLVGMWNEVEQRGTMAYTGIRRQAANAMQQIIQSQKKMLDETAKQQAAIAGKREASFFISGLRKQFVTPETSSQDAGRFRALFGRLSELSAKANMTRQKLNTIWTDVQKNGTTAFTGLNRQVATTMQQIVNTHANATSKMTKHVDSILISWKSLLRIASVHVIHDLVNLLTSSIRNASSEASKLQINISEIRTLSQENQLNASEWASGIRGISDSFGLLNEDISKGTYETLSNQITDGAESFMFMDDAAKLAIITVSSIEDSVNVLSSVINAYGLKITDAEKISAQLFKAVDLGRFRLGDIANTLGRVTMTSSQLGIKFSELAASLDVLTLKGMPVDEAMTGIRNVMIKLIRPTEEMKKLYAQLGVSSGEQLVKTKGWLGTIKLLADEGVEGMERLGELFNRIRATQGALGLTQAFDQMVDFTKQIEEAGPEAAKALDISMESAAKNLQVQMRKMSNIIEFEFIIPILDKLANFTKNFMTFPEMFNALRVAIVPAIATLTTFIITYKLLTRTIWTESKLAMVIELIKTHTLATISSVRAVGMLQTAWLGMAATGKAAWAGLVGFVTSPLGVAAMAAASVGYLVYHSRKLGEFYLEAARVYESITFKIKTESEKQTEIVKTELDKQVSLMQGLLDANIRKLLEANAEAKKAANKRLNDQKEVNRLLDEDFDLLAEGYLSNFKLAIDQVKDFGKEIKQSLETDVIKAIEDSIKRVKDFRSSFSDMSFENRLNMEDFNGQLKLMRSRFDELALAAKELFKAGDIEQSADRFAKAQGILDKMFETTQKMHEKEREDLEGRAKDLIKDIQELRESQDEARENIYKGRAGRKPPSVKEQRLKKGRIIDAIQELIDLKVKESDKKDELAKVEGLIRGLSTESAKRKELNSILERGKTLVEQRVALEEKQQALLRERKEMMENQIKAAEIIERRAEAAFKVFKARMDDIKKFKLGEGATPEKLQELLGTIYDAQNAAKPIFNKTEMASLLVMLDEFYFRQREILESSDRSESFSKDAQIIINKETEITKAVTETSSALKESIKISGQRKEDILKMIDALKKSLEGRLNEIHLIDSIFGNEDARKSNLRESQFFLDQLALQFQHFKDVIDPKDMKEAFMNFGELASALRQSKIDFSKIVVVPEKGVKGTEGFEPSKSIADFVSDLNAMLNQIDKHSGKVDGATKAYDALFKRITSMGPELERVIADYNDMPKAIEDISKPINEQLDKVRENLQGILDKLRDIKKESPKVNPSLPNRATPQSSGKPMSGNRIQNFNINVAGGNSSSGTAKSIVKAIRSEVRRSGLFASLT